MATGLDQQLKAAMDRITGPGAPFEVHRIEHRGIALPAFRHAPPNLPALFAQWCAHYGEAEFLVDGAARLTFAETYALAERAAQGLIARHGLQRGDRVGIAARNSVGWIISYMGVLMAGGCAVLINAWWSGEELAGGIALADCTIVLADDERAARIAGQQIAARVVTIGHDQPEDGLASILSARGDSVALPAIAGDDLATIVFTSGSTGISKGAVSDHFAVVQATMNFAAGSLAARAAMAPAPDTAPAPQLSVLQPTALVAMPLFHVAGEIALVLQSFMLGRRLVLMSRWDAKEAMILIERERVTGFLGVPLMTLELIAHPERGQFDLSTCALLGAGGAPTPADHAEKIRAAMPGTAALLGYGLTETNSVGCFNLGANYVAKPDSTGPATGPLVEVAILDADHRPLPAGLRGEIAMRTICAMTGYWRNPVETAAAFTADGFFLTGDLGYLDEDGYLFIADRKKDIIIRGGENISCLEVEQAIYMHGAVAEASVFGMPCSRYGEVPVAVFAAKPGQPLSEDELRRHLQGSVAAFKVPVRLWREAHRLPRLGSEKIDKRALKARYSQHWEAATAAS